MSRAKMKYDEEFKKNAVKISHASPKTVADVASDLGIKPERLYAWRKKYTADGDKTRFATLEEENKALRLEVAQLAMERDMLKKATVRIAKKGDRRRRLLRSKSADYFANLKSNPKDIGQAKPGFA